MDIETFKALDEPAKFAATMFAYVPYPLNSTSLGGLFKRRFGEMSESSMPAKVAASAIKTLAGRKLVDRKGATSSSYIFGRGTSAKDVVDILDEAATRHWLPTAADLGYALDGELYGNEKFTVIAKQAECARKIAKGSGASMSDAVAKALSIRGGLQIARGAAWHAARIIADEPVETAFRAGGKWDWRLVASFAALCFWVGWRQGLETALAVSVSQPPHTGGRYDEDADEVFHQTLNACQFAMEGKFAHADIAFKTAEKFDDDLDSRATVECRQVDNVPERLLASMCAAVANPEKIAKRRPERIMEQTWYDASTLWGDRDLPEEHYADFVEEFSREFSCRWKDVVTCSGVLLRKYNSKLERVFPSGIPFAWDFRLLASGREKWKETARSLLLFAESAERAGYINIAQLYLTLLSGSYAEEEMADLLKRVSATSVKFLPDLCQQDEWKNMLEAMRKTVKGASRAAKRDADKGGDRVFWQLIVEKPEKDGRYELRYLEPVLRPSGNPEDRKLDQRLSQCDVEKKKNVAFRKGQGHCPRNERERRNHESQEAWRDFPHACGDGQC